MPPISPFLLIASATCAVIGVPPGSGTSAVRYVVEPNEGDFVVAAQSKNRDVRAGLSLGTASHLDLSPVKAPYHDAR